MPLTVALALSGLEPDQWNGDLKEIYNQGAALFSKGGLSKSPSASSIASSTGASSYHSLESGISSMSPDSYNYQCLSNKNKFEAFLVHGIDHFERESDKTPEPEVHAEIEVEIKEAKIEQTAYAAKATLTYSGRNLLDLGSNLSDKQQWSFQYAKLPRGVDAFFNNRSQYSRVQGTFTPNHTKAQCHNTDCSFVEPLFF